jgi:hypothetical protein
MSDHDNVSPDHHPRHLLETGLLGKPKHGMQRVSDLAAKRDESADAESSPERAETVEDKEQIE